MANKVSFRAICEFCEADLHVCQNCQYYSTGRPNDCLVPNTEYVSDREKNNFCEEFSPLTSSKNEQKLKQEEVAKKLFKDEDGDTTSSFSFDFFFKEI
jgi:hypothetical protein